MTMAEGDYRRREIRRAAFLWSEMDGLFASLAPTAAGECCESVALWEGGDGRRRG